MFITNKDLTERDIKGSENKIKQFLKDIGYKQRGDTKSNRSKLTRRMFANIVNYQTPVKMKNINVILVMKKKKLITRLINK